jgi:glycerol kinase
VVVSLPATKSAKSWLICWVFHLSARPFTETTARAAALLAGLGAGVWPNLAGLPPLPGDYITFEPRLSADQRDAAHAQWQRAVERATSWSEG